MSDLTSYSTKEVGYYQTILFDLLYEGGNTGISDENYTKLKSVVKNVNKAYKTVNISALKQLNKLDLVITADTVITDDNLDDVLKALQKDDAVSRALDYVGSPKKYLGYINTVTDFIDKLAKIEALLQLSEDYAEIIKDMVSYTKSSATGLLLKASLTDFANLCKGTVTEEEIAAVFITGTAIQTIGNKVLDNCWKEVLSLSSWVGLMITAGQTIGKYASNWMFSTDAIVETYYTMSALSDIEDALYSEVSACKAKYLANKTEENAKKFNTAVRLLFRLHKIGINYARNFVEVVHKGGNLSQLFTYLDSSEYDKVSSAINSIQNSMETVLDDIEDFVYNLYRDEYTKIEIEYGDLTEVETNSITDEEYERLLGELQQTAVRCNNIYVEKTKNSDTYTLSGDLEIYGDLYIKSGTLNLNGHTLTVGGDCFHTGGQLNVNGGRLNVIGNYRLQGRTMDAETGEVTFGGCDGHIVMDGENDYVCVNGDFITESRLGDSYNVYSAGTMELKGNFTQKYAASGNSIRNFVESGTHKVVFSGEGRQVVSFESVSYSHFSDIVMENTDIEFATEIQGWKLKRDTTFTNGLPNGMVGTFDLDGKTMTVNEEFLHSSGIVDINGGKLIVNGDYRIQSRNSDGAYGGCDGHIIMDVEDDYVCVNGDFITESRLGDSYNVYSAGTMELKGNFTQKYAASGNSIRNFVESETHKVVFSGEGRQVVSFESPSASYFTNLDMQNEDIEFASRIKIASIILSENTVFGNGLPNGFIGSFDLKGNNVTMKGDFLQTEGEVLTNGGTLTVTGNYTKNNGDIIATTGKIVVEGNFETKAGTTTLSEKSSMKVGGIIQSGGTTDLNSSMVEVTNSLELSGGAIQINSGSMTVSGNTVVSSGTANLDSGTITVNGTLTQTGGTINLNQGILNANSDYIMESETYNQATDTTSKTNSGGTLNMQYAADKVNIGGNFVMHSGNSHSGNLKAGTITVKGDFSQVGGNSSDFAASGANMVIFAGTKKQKVSFDNPSGSGFNYVRFDNSNVEITTAIKGWTLQQDTVIDSNIPGFTGTWDLNGHMLTIGGTFIQNAGTVNINKGSLAVKGNYEIEGETYDQTTDTTSKSNSNGSLLMKYAADRVEVDGDFIMHSSVSHSSNLVSGVLTLKGNFRQVNGSSSNFATSTANKVVFAGNETQMISFDSPSYSGFTDVEFRNSDVNITTSLKGWTLQNDTVIKSNIAGFTGTWDLNGHKLTIDGNLIQTGGTINLNNGVLHVKGNYEIESETYDSATDITSKSNSSGVLVMTKDSDVVKVDGNFIMHSSVNHSSNLIAGKMYIKGDFRQVEGNSSNFKAGGSHTVVLNGNSLQHISFQSESSAFYNMVLTKDSDTYYEFSRESCWTNLEKQIVNGIRISQGDLSVAKGEVQQFTAELEGQGSVVWSIEGNKSMETTISADGLLHVAADESASVIFVKATADLDDTKVATVTVSIINQEHIHNYGTVFQSNAIGHWKECDCGEKSEAADHTFGKWTVTKEASCTNDGIQTHICKICKYSETKEILAAGHMVVIVDAKPATCKEEGNIEYYTCSVCGKYFSDSKATEEISPSEIVAAKKGHSYVTYTVKATTKKNGSIVKKCSVCGEVTDTMTIYYPKTVSLSVVSYTFTGKALKPAITVKDSNGNLIPSSNYSIKYSSNKSVGKATAKITFKGKYSGTISKTFTINPKGTSVSNVSAKSKGFIVKWKKQAAQTTGYEIQYSTSKKFTKKTTLTKIVKKTSTTKLSVSKLKAKKRYYVRIRTYKIVKGIKYYSAWSKSRSITVEK